MLGLILIKFVCFLSIHFIKLITCWVPANGQFWPSVLCKEDREVLSSRDNCGFWVFCFVMRQLCFLFVFYFYFLFFVFLFFLKWIFVFVSTRRTPKLQPLHLLLQGLRCKIQEFLLNPTLGWLVLCLMETNSKRTGHNPVLLKGKWLQRFMNFTRNRTTKSIQ